MRTSCPVCSRIGRSHCSSRMPALRANSSPFLAGRGTTSACCRRRRCPGSPLLYHPPCVWLLVGRFVFLAVCMCARSRHSRAHTCLWLWCTRPHRYTGKTLLGAIETMPLPEREPGLPLCFSVANVYKVHWHRCWFFAVSLTSSLSVCVSKCVQVAGIGTVPVGRIDVGSVSVGQEVIFAPAMVL